MKNGNHESRGQHERQAATRYTHRLRRLMSLVLPSASLRQLATTIGR